MSEKEKDIQNWKWALKLCNENNKLEIGTEVRFHIKQALRYAIEKKQNE